MVSPCAVVLAAGLGTRLRPLTEILPKPLCPVANRPLLDHALERVAPHVEASAVNIHHHRDALARHLADRRVHVSIEEDEPLGTAGGVGNLRDWIDGRPVLVANSDAFGPRRLDRLVEGWDGSTVRLLVGFRPDRPDFDGLWRYAGAGLHPWDDVRRLPAEPAGLYETCWRPAQAEGRLELVPTDDLVIDCGTPGAYLGANLVCVGPEGMVAGTAEVAGEVRGGVVGAGARVAGVVDHSVVWPGAAVDPDEHLRHAIRMPDGRTLTPFGE